MKKQQSQNDRSELTLAFWLNFIFSIIEVVGGILTNSTAIITDALHDFTDATAISFAVWIEKLSSKKRTSKFSYGYKRFSLLSALGMSLLLITGAILMITNAIESFINPQKVYSVGMLWLAILGIAINGFAFIKIRNKTGHHHAHSHQHDHSNNHNSKAIMLHLLEDVLSWGAVLIGALIIYFTDWYWIDGALAISIAIFIGYNAIRNLTGTMKVLLQSVPETVNVEQLTNKLQQIDGVKDIHDLHIWSLDGDYNVCTLHAIVDDIYINRHSDISSTIMQILEEYQINHPTIQIETSSTSCKLINC